MEKDLIIIAIRENSSMVSYWTEYLCLQKGVEKRFRIFTGMYEGLDTASKYYNEDTEEYDLPEKIDGKEVVKVDDDVVIGGELGYFDPDDMIEFDSLEDTHVEGWLENSRWKKIENIKSLLQKKLTNISN